MQALTIGEVAKAADIGVETVRFYEREGLIAEPPRRQSGYRQYPPDTIRRLRFIRRAKDLGFTLKEIGELLDLHVDPTRSCADVRAFGRGFSVDNLETMRLFFQASGRVAISETPSRKLALARRDWASVLAAGRPAGARGAAVIASLSRRPAGLDFAS